MISSFGAMKAPEGRLELGVSEAVEAKTRWALEAIVTRVFRLPPPTTSYTVEPVSVPMRDGVELVGHVFQPDVASGTILVQSPYGYPTPLTVVSGSWLARRGYRVVMMRCRGTYGSGGRFEPFLHDVRDGADTVEWMRRQPWFEGRFATYGMSYMGFVQWAMLMDPPPELVTAVVGVGPHDFHQALFPGGGFSLNDFLGWAIPMRAPHGRAYKNIIPVRSQRAARRAADLLPLDAARSAVLGDEARWFSDWLERDPGDPYWAPMQCGEALDRAEIPILIQSGWQDLFVRQSFEQYERLAARGGEVGLTVGPWSHGAPMGRIPFNEALDWLEQHLRAGETRARVKPVRIYVSGADQWRDLGAWPPPTTNRVYHLGSDGQLTAEAAVGEVASFTYDPADPTPSIGGAVLAGGGYKDDSALAERGDVLAFTTEPLRAPLEVIGRPVFEVSLRSDNPHADLFVRLSEVDADGKSRNVTDGFVRLDPTATDGSIRIELDPVAHRFGARRRIRLLLAGGAFPRWDRNLGTGERAARSARMMPSTRTVDLARSRVVLPVSC
jgi:uncharacterized protein